MKYHYVYRITNKEVGKYYYGKRSSKIPPKDDLGIRYFSSSTDKEFLIDQKVNADRYKYKIVRKFKTSEEAIAFEVILHSKFNVSINQKFYNKAKQTSIGFDTTGIKYTDERRREISNLSKGRVMSEETKEKIRQSKKLLSVESRYAMGKGNRGKHLSDATKQKLRDCNVGKSWSETSKQAKSAAMTGKGNSRAKLVNVYDYYTGQLLAAGVISKEWCANNKGYKSEMLLQTLKRDVNKPHLFSPKNVNYNPLHYKGLYVELVSKDE